MKDLSDTQIKILKFCTLLLSAAPLIWVICDIFDNFHAKSQIGVVGDGFLLVFALYVFAAINPFCRVVITGGIFK